ncbi:hypothetical protein ACN1C3_12055 [Pseudomonas sp. H11T01]|uniref:hypothetical protein n=1 Tax=Pseudomonas sp. H11T01 TaxID=3402749 RepID=UPI003AD2DB43
MRRSFISCFTGLSGAYRRWCEVRAYRQQIAIGGYTSQDFAVTALLGKYDLELDTDEAMALLAD